MDKPNYPTITPTDIEDAQRARVTQLVGALHLAGGLAVGYAAAGAPGGMVGRLIQKGYTGVDIHPRPGQSPSMTLGKLSLPSVFLPTPVGYVPAEFYGLHPDFLEKATGIHIGKHLPFVAADKSRVNVFEAQQRGEQIVDSVQGSTSGHDPHQSQAGVARGRRIDIGNYELEFLRSLPAGTSNKVALFLAAIDRGDLVPRQEPRSAPVERAQVVGHLVHLKQPGDKTVEAIEAPKGGYYLLGAGGSIRGFEPK